MAAKQTRRSVGKKSSTESQARRTTRIPSGSIKARACEGSSRR